MSLRSTLLMTGLALSFQASAEKVIPRLELDAGGDVEIAADGQVSDYHLNSKLSPAVAGLVERAVRNWKFEPVIIDGKAVRAKTSMRLTLSAEPLEKEQYAVRVESVDFGAPNAKPGKVKPPHYPSDLVRARVGGKTVLNAKLDGEGKVVEVYPYQTSLDVRMRTEADAERYRKALERAAVASVKTWEFDLGETIDGKLRKETYVVLPMEFYVCAVPCRKPKEDEWKAFVPGPIHPAPWADATHLPTDAELASLKDGQARSIDSRIHLKDDVIGKTL